MAYEEKDNHGVVTKKENKEKDWHADYSGRGMVNGELKWIDLTGPKINKNGEEDFSVKIRERKPWSGGSGKEKYNKSYLDSYDPDPPQKEGDNIPF